MTRSAAVFGEPPTTLRDPRAAPDGWAGRAGPDRRTRGQRATAGRRPSGAVTGAATGDVLTVRLAYRAPMASEELFGFLAARAVPGVEEGDCSYYRRSLVLPHGLATATVRSPAPGERFLLATIALGDLRDLTTAVKRLRQLFDLDADPEAVSEVLRGDPLLSRVAAGRPGIRAPGHVDGDELALRAVLGQASQRRGRSLPRRQPRRGAWGTAGSPGGKRGYALSRRPPPLRR